MKATKKGEKKCFICGATKNLVRTEGIAQLADESATVMLKMELKHTKIKRVITIPGHLTLLDLNNVVQAMFGFEHDHLWNFKDEDGNEYNACCDPMGGPLDMDDEDMLDPEDYAIDDVLLDKGDRLLYEYDYGDGWEIVVTRMADPKSCEVACVETCGTNTIEDIGSAAARPPRRRLPRSSPQGDIAEA